MGLGSSLTRARHVALYLFFAKAGMPTRVPSLSEKEIKEANTSVKKLQEKNIAKRSANTPANSLQRLTTVDFTSLRTPRNFAWEREESGKYLIAAQTHGISRRSLEESFPRVSVWIDKLALAPNSHGHIRAVRRKVKSTVLGSPAFQRATLKSWEGPGDEAI